MVYYGIQWYLQRNTRHHRDCFLGVFFSLYNPTEAIHLLLWRSPRDTAQRGRSQPPLISKCQSLLKGLAAEVH